MFKLPSLPYDYDALEPYISARTMHCHYDDHHQGYLKKLNNALDDIDFEYRTVEDIVKKTAGRKELTHVYNNAAQVWNHAFFWNCMKAGGGGEPTGELKEAIERDFGSFQSFRRAFIDRATARFGSGYVWLVKRDDNLVIRDSANADPSYVAGDPPFTSGNDPLLCCDLWEHAYYLDYQNGRAEFVETFIDNLVDWDFVSAQLVGDTVQPRLVAAE